MNFNYKIFYWNPFQGVEFNPYGESHKNFLEAQIKHVQNLFKYFFWAANSTILLMMVVPAIPVGTYDVMQNSNQSLEYLIGRRKLPLDWSNKHFNMMESPMWVIEWQNFETKILYFTFRYEITYCGQILVIIWGCFVAVSIDCFVSGLLHTIATQFDVLSIEIQRLGNY